MLTEPGLGVSQLLQLTQIPASNYGTSGMPPTVSCSRQSGWRAAYTQHKTQTNLLTTGSTSMLRQHESSLT